MLNIFPAFFPLPTFFFLPLPFLLPKIFPEGSWGHSTLSMCKLPSSVPWQEGRVPDAKQKLKEDIQNLPVGKPCLGGWSFHAPPHQAPPWSCNETPASFPFLVALEPSDTVSGGVGRCLSLTSQPQCLVYYLLNIYFKLIHSYCLNK